MRASFDPKPAGLLIADAWRNGRQLSGLPAELRPRTLSEGYDVQDSFIAAMGEPLSGWKLGVGSVAAMRAAGHERPLVGRIFDSRRYRSGAIVPLASRAPVMVEFEIAFVLARDVVPAESLPVPREVIAAVHTTFEFVLSRFVDRRGAGFPSFVGDNVGFEALVVGSTIDIAQVADVAPGIVVSVNGEERARGMSGDNFTDPFAALGALLEHARERGVSLRRGDIVTTGANATPFDIPGEDAEIVARFANCELRAQTRVP